MDFQEQVLMKKGDFYLQSGQSVNSFLFFGEG